MFDCNCYCVNKIKKQDGEKKVDIISYKTLIGNLF